ncbi:MAG: fasciclin domain-containing protein [Acetobacteraceae bacterium]|nr:fasciclin domain-containing protein [Acetobacteraceae bacterium]
MLDRRLFLLTASAAAMPLVARAQMTAPQATVTPSLQLANTNVVDAMAQAGNFDSFIELIQRAGLTDRLRGAGPFTVLAPVNSAIDRIPVHIRDMLNPQPTGNRTTTDNLPDPVRLPALINMHIIPGRYTFQDLQGRTAAFRTLNGNTVEIAQAGSDPFRLRTVGDTGFGIGGVNAELRPANFLNPEIIASNGVVLPINIPLIQ